MRKDTLEAAVATLSTPDTVALADAVGRWCRERWPGCTVHDVHGKGASGASSELLFIDLSGHGHSERETLVMRLASRWPVYPHEDLTQQALCLEVLARGLPARLRVPQVLAVETQGLADTGRPFLLMSRVTGRPAPDRPSYVLEGWLHELSDSERESLWHAGIDAIAAVHACPLTSDETLDLQLPVSGESPLLRLLNYWSLFLRHVELRGHYPALRGLIDWLCQHTPDMDSASCLVWGDASLRNMLFEGLSPRILLDFEFAHAGLRELDVAFFPLMDYVMAEGFADGAPRLPGFSGLNASMDYYESLSGHPVRHRSYFLRMALGYMALSTTRVYQRLAARGDIPASAVALNPPLRLLEEVQSGRHSLPD